MIHNTLVWTKRGWKRSEELAIGDKIISYSHSRNCTEYDEISSIQIDYGIKPIIGLRTHSMNMCVTPDHPIIIVDHSKKEMEVKSIDSTFLSSIKRNKSVLYTSPFEPYMASGNLEDVAWSARVASSFGNVLATPLDIFQQTWKSVEDISGLEAQHWVDIFFHWCVLQPGTYWSKAMPMSNKQTVELAYHVAPRAGFGVRYMRNPKNSARQWMLGLSVNNNPEIRPDSWYQDRIEGFFFNIKTRNGNFLARKTGGTFLCACEVT